MTDAEMLAMRIKQVTAQRRRRAIRWRRFCSNAHQRPWLLACALLLLFILGRAMTLVEIPLPGGSSYPFLLALWNGTAKLAIILIASLLTLYTFTAPPKKALEYEAGLAHIRFTDRYGNPPALVSRVCTNKIERLTFYSAGISLELWKRRQGDVQDTLNVEYFELPKYYQKSHYILLTVVPGIGGPRKENLYDDDEV